MPTNPEEYARVLYSTLREADQAPTTDILIEMPPDEAEWGAIRDRIRRATRAV
jgi:L-threonylcarbamoyladenylate synthase